MAERDIQSILDFVEGLGREHGRGPVGRFILATFLCARAHDSDRLLEPDDAEAVMQAMRRGSGNDSPSVANDLRPFIALGRRQDIDGPDLLRSALLLLIGLRDRNKVQPQRSWACLAAFAHHQSEAKRPMSLKAIELLIKRSST